MMRDSDDNSPGRKTRISLPGSDEVPVRIISGLFSLCRQSGRLLFSPFIMVME